ncbi:unnamed protein product [Caenorhabditis sp. 36 PRJEB53466]|nr:unnamed protein product [Caenorhabditis sp. 36 PRJEB53466]
MAVYPTLLILSVLVVGSFHELTEGRNLQKLGTTATSSGNMDAQAEISKRSVDETEKLALILPSGRDELHHIIYFCILISIVLILIALILCYRLHAERRIRRERLVVQHGIRMIQHGIFDMTEVPIQRTAYGEDSIMVPLADEETLTEDNRSEIIEEDLHITI